MAFNVPSEKTSITRLLEYTGALTHPEMSPIVTDDHITRSLESMRNNSLDGSEIYNSSLIKKIKLSILQTGLSRIDAMRAVLRRGPDLNRYITPKEVLSTEAIGNSEHKFGFFFSPKGVHEQKRIYGDNLKWYSGTAHPEFDPIKNKKIARSKNTRANRLISAIRSKITNKTDNYDKYKEPIRYKVPDSRTIKEAKRVSKIQPLVTKLIDDTMRLYRHNKKPDIVAKSKKGIREIDYGKTENYTPEQAVRLVFRDNVAELAIANSDRVFRYADLTLDQYHAMILESNDPYALGKLLCNGLNNKLKEEFSRLDIKINSVDSWYENDGNIIAIGAQSTKSESPHLLSLIRDPRFAATSLIEFDLDEARESFTPRRLTHRSGHSQSTAVPVKKQLAETVVKLAKNKSGKPPSSSLLTARDPIDYDQTAIYDPELAKLSPNLALDQANLYFNSFANPAAAELCKIFNLAEINLRQELPKDMITLVKLNSLLHQKNHFHPDAKPLNTDYWAKALLAITGQPAYKATEPNVAPDVTNAVQMALAFNEGLPHIQRLIEKTKQSLTKKEIRSPSYADPEILSITHNSDTEGNISIDDVFAILLRQQMAITEETNNAKEGHAIANTLALAVGPLRDLTEGFSNDAAATLLAQLMSGSQVSNLNSITKEEANLVAHSSFTTAGSRTVVNGVGIINNEATFRHQPDDPVTFMEILSKYDNPELYSKLIRKALETTKDPKTGEYKLWELDQGDINTILWLEGRLKQSQTLTDKEVSANTRRLLLHKNEETLLRKYESLLPIDVIENKIIKLFQNGNYDDSTFTSSEPRVWLSDKQVTEFNKLVKEYSAISGVAEADYTQQLFQSIRECLALYKSEISQQRNDLSLNIFDEPDYHPSELQLRYGLSYLGTSKDRVYTERRKRLLSLDAYVIAYAAEYATSRSVDVQLDTLTLGDQHFTNLETAIEAANKDSALKTELLLVANRISNILTELNGSDPEDKKVIEDIRNTYRFLITHRAISTNVDTAVNIVGHTAFYIHYLVSNLYSGVTTETSHPPIKNDDVSKLAENIGFDYQNPTHYSLLCQQASAAGIPADAVSNHIFNLVLKSTDVLPWIREYADPSDGYLASLSNNNFQPKPLP
ncbi:hypothetical protein KBD69_05420 [Candidatus Woesebacteria bacterium]|nr:hypothetical protein [Candidatus Woesebacteria bacterium]